MANPKYFSNEDPDPVGALWQENARLTKRISDLEREVRNVYSVPALPRIDPITHPNPYEGMRGIDVADEQHTWYSNGTWRKAKAGPTYHIKMNSDVAIVVAGDAPQPGRISIVTIEEDINGMEFMNGAGAPYIGVELSVTTASTSGIVQVQIRNIDNGNVDVLSTRVQCDANETHSRTAATTAVVNAANAAVAHGDRLGIDIDAAGTGAKGMEVIMRFQVPA